MEKYTAKTVEKVKRLSEKYRAFLYSKVSELPCEIAEIPAPDRDPAARSRFRCAMPSGPWRPVRSGDTWGEEFSYAWIRAKAVIGEDLAGQKLWLRPDVGLVEGLLFLDGRAAGIFDTCPDIPSDFRLHDVQPLTGCAREGEVIDIAIECYAGHTVLGTRPEDNGSVDKWSFYPANFTRTFRSLDLVVRDETLARFLTLHEAVKQVIDTEDEYSAAHAAAVNAFCEIFRLLPQFPDEAGYFSLIIIA